MIAYHIVNQTSDHAEHNITPSRAAELQAAGWLISETPIVWAENQYIDGEIVAIPVVVPDQPAPYIPTPAEPQSYTANDSMPLSNDSTPWNFA